jgi:cytoskeletal protein CcmA (bactofilin family)
MSIFKRNQDPPFNTRSPVVNAQGDRASANAFPDVTARPVNPPAAPVAAAAATTPPPAALVPPPVSTAELRETAAVLDRKTEITGTLHSDGNVLIEGCFQGEIEARETVWVEKGAQSRGQLRANDAVISGSVDGEIACEHRLQIAATAVVTGEIKTPVLVIEEGATINCRFNMVRTER